MTGLRNLIMLVVCLSLTRLGYGQPRALPITLLGEGPTKHGIFAYYQDEFQDPVRLRFDAAAADQWQPVHLAVAHPLWLQLSGEGMQQSNLYVRPGDTVYVRPHPGQSSYYSFRRPPGRRVASAEARFFTVLQQHGLGIEYPDAMGLLFTARYPFQLPRMALKRDRRLALLQRQRDSLLLSPAFVRFAAQQIQLHYLHVVLAPYWDPEYGFRQFPASYADQVAAARPTSLLAHDSLVLVSSSYRSAAVSYVHYLSRDSLATAAEFATQYHQARTALRGRTRDYVWFFLLKQHREQPPAAYAACYAQFRRECTTQAYVRYLDSLVARPHALQQRPDLLRTPLLSSTGDTLTWGQLVARNHGQPTYLDLWASWCIPCLAEMPASDTLQASPAGRDVHFVYLSIDKDKAAWLRAIQRQGLQRPGRQHYLLDPHSALATFLNVPPIPRYVLLDKQGRAVSLEAPRPSEARLAEALEKLRAAP